MRKLKKPVVQYTDDNIAFDQDMRVFAGYRDGYPYWSSNYDDFKYVNSTKHLNTLRSWFPNKQIELIKP